MDYSTVVLYLNKKCNLRCPNCIWVLKGDNFFSDEKMSIKEAKKILDYFYSKGIRRCRLQSEGEVLTYPYYEEMVRYVNAKGFGRMTLITNGVLLDKYSDFILKNIGSIVISVDGYNAKEYSKIRGGGEKIFNKVKDNIVNFVNKRDSINSNMKIKINCVVGTHNYKNMIPMIYFVDKLKVNGLNFRNYHPVFGGNNYGALYNNKEVVKYIKEAKSHLKNVNIDVSFPKLQKSGGVNFQCAGMLNQTILIGPKGDFSPCCHMEADGSYGNFWKNKSGYENDSKKQKLIKKMSSAKTYSDIPNHCKDCPRLVRRFK
ncbi:MAG: radical SAM protein [bacterium]